MSLKVERSSRRGDRPNREDDAHRSILLPPSLRRRALPPDFYDWHTEEVALQLLGSVVCSRSNGALRAGRIVEVEAYLGQIDPACHVKETLTQRTRDVVGRPGAAYVFKAYGLHHCLNAMTLKEPPYGCVLIRAVEPWDLRNNQPMEHSCEHPSGPGLVGRYLGVQLSHNGTSLFEGPIAILDMGERPSRIDCGPRIGISTWKEAPLRFYDAGSQYVPKR